MAKLIRDRLLERLRKKINFFTCLIQFASTYCNKYNAYFKYHKQVIILNYSFLRFRNLCISRMLTEQS